MSEKPIYIDLGDGTFSLWKVRRKRLWLRRGHDPFRSRPDAIAGRRFVEDEHLLRHNSECEADMISLGEPAEATWELLRQFIVAERGW